MTHCYSEDEQIRSSEDVCQRQKKLKFWINVMHHHMEDTLQETGQPRKFYNQDFIGLPYSETILNELNIVIDAREWAT